MPEEAPDNNRSLMIARDFLARDRTCLANERTLLAYIRTGLMFLGTGLTFAKVFPEDAAMVSFGWIFMGVSLPVFVLGFYRFFDMRRRLSGNYPQEPHEDRLQKSGNPAE